MAVKTSFLEEASCHAKPRQGRKGRWKTFFVGGQQVAALAGIIRRDRVFASSGGSGSVVPAPPRRVATVGVCIAPLGVLLLLRPVGAPPF